MKRMLLLLTVLVFLLVPRTQAKDLQALFYHASFFHPEEGPFVETYLKVFGPSAEYIKLSNGKYQATLDITILFKQEEKIVDFRKYNLLSAELDDTTGVIPHFIDLQRISLPYGVYQLELLLKDKNSKTDPLEHAEVLALEFDKTKVKFSDFQFVDSFKATEKENILSKSGFDIVPLVGDFFPTAVNTLTFYTEFYNAADKIGQNEDFLFRYYIESFETNFSLSDFSRFARQKAANVNPLLASLSIGALPSGNYNLVVEVRDRNNELIDLNKIFFMRSNPGITLDLGDLASVDVTATFAEKITNMDSLRFYVGSLIPISNMVEKQFADNLSKGQEIDKLQKFLFNFWKTRNEVDPESEWKAYLIQVMQVEEAFATRIKHGFETDQGRVWLRYGAPNDVIDSKHEPNSYPYVIWHYYRINDQMNKRFVFYNPNLVGAEYQLLHSDAKGELYNPYWQYDLHGRNTYLRNYGETNVDAGYGSRSGEWIRR